MAAPQDKREDTIFEKLWYPSGWNWLHVVSVVFAVAAFVVVIAWAT